MNLNEEDINRPCARCGAFWTINWEYYEKLEDHRCPSCGFEHVMLITQSFDGGWADLVDSALFRDWWWLYGREHYEQYLKVMEELKSK